jgi:DDE superfamily endonuclease/Helix-turn-helix of DDE superfamily endonuclease
MSIRYTKIRNQPKTFHRLFGVTPQEFAIILKKVEPMWHERVVSGYKRPGRDYKLDLSDMVLMLLLYYRSYVTQIFVGYMFGIDDSRVCRIFKVLEPILASVMAIQKCKKLLKEEVESLLMDATEQPIERPKRRQRPYYSGKKKRHSLKTEIRTTLAGRIVHVSQSHPGSTHDFTVFKAGKRPPKESRLYVDSGYQGIADIHPNADFPYKSGKNKPLDHEEKAYNTVLSQIRVKVEHVFAQIKTFKILSDRYRNKRRRYGIKFNIIAGIVNLKNGFGVA